MSNAASFPPHPFWDYSLALYARPGVAPACIVLQDDYGLNVNVLLFCAWYAARHGALSPVSLREALAAIEDWDAQVVQPLRAVRRFCADADGLGGGQLDQLARERVRQSVQAAELDAEHLEQLLLAAVEPPAANQTPAADQALVDMVGNLRGYLSVMHVESDPTINGHLNTLVSAAFPAAPADVMRDAPG